MAKLVVPLFFIRVTEYFISFSSFLELLLSFLIIRIFIGVELQRFFCDMLFLFLRVRLFCSHPKFRNNLFSPFLLNNLLFSDYNFGKPDYLIIE